MLDHLRGTVYQIHADAAVISVGGAGVRVEMPTRDLASLEGDVLIHTVLIVKDDAMHLYGFRTDHDRELFLALTSVSGVGPKVALAVLSFHTPEGLERAIATDDPHALTLVPGVGKKTAGRIVLELKDRLGVPAEAARAPTGSPVAEVREALRGMGFSDGEVQTALADLPPDGDAPTLLRHALRGLGASDPAGARR